MFGGAKSFIPETRIRFDYPRYESEQMMALELRPNVVSILVNSSEKSPKSRFKLASLATSDSVRSGRVADGGLSRSASARMRHDLPAFAFCLRSRVGLNQQTGLPWNRRRSSPEYALMCGAGDGAGAA